ncbi:ABC transporter permease subunit [Pseudomonas aeruginosa]|nr:ABC transporter permease subunit [Pseudomonas aeruginosa]
MRLRTSSRRRTPFWLFLPVLLLALLASLPLLYVAAKAWDAGWHSAWQLLWRPYVFRLLGNTLWLMFGVTLLSALLGLALAWCVERSDLPARRFWNVVLCLPFAIPAFVSSFTWVSLSPMYEGLGGAILVMTMSKYPLVYLPVAATLRGIDPSLEESARMLGLSRRQVFLRVTLPLLRPTLAATGLLVALHMLVEFGALSILRYQTFTTAIYQEFELEFSNATAAMLSSVLLALLLPAALAGVAHARPRPPGTHRPGQRAAGRTGPPGAWQVAAPGAAGDAGAGRYRYPPGDARLLAVRRLLGQLPADGNRLDPAFLPVAGLRRGPLSCLAGAAGKHPGGALPRRPGALDPAPAVPAASVAGTGDRPLAGVLRCTTCQPPTRPPACCWSPMPCCSCR